MVGYRHSVPPDKWWDWLGRDRTRDEVDPWDEQHAWLEDEFGWVGEQLAALTDPPPQIMMVVSRVRRPVSGE